MQHVMQLFSCVSSSESNDRPTHNNDGIITANGQLLAYILNDIGLTCTQ